MAALGPPHYRPLGSRRQEGRQILDAAVGLLIGLRRCDADTAFHELIRAAERNEVAVFSMACALVGLASGQPRRNGEGIDAQLAAEREWGESYWP
jgi:hypothetical protein